MSTPSLPLLRGTPGQIKWALAIRENGLNNAMHAPNADMLSQINDATWWIANRSAEDGSTLAGTYKSPLPYQLVGGPHAPATGRQKELAMDTDAEREPHEAELFAASVCHIPALGELAVLATLSRLYKGEESQVMRHRVELRLETLRDDLIAAIDKDIDGVRRILGRKK